MACKSNDPSEIDNHQTDKTHSIARRRVLKATLAGGALSAAHLLPGTWIKPVVNFITLPAHAQTSSPPPPSTSPPLPSTSPPPPSPTPPPPSPACGCQLLNLSVNSRANTFSATYTFSNCSAIALGRLVITGPGVVNSLGYTQGASGPSGSRVFTDVAPYNATVFGLGQIYTFTFTAEDAGNNVIKTCTSTVVATS